MARVNPNAEAEEYINQNRKNSGPFSSYNERQETINAYNDIRKMSNINEFNKEFSKLLDSVKDYADSIKDSDKKLSDSLSDLYISTSSYNDSLKDSSNTVETNAKTLTLIDKSLNKLLPHISKSADLYKKYNNLIANEKISKMLDNANKIMEITKKNLSTFEEELQKSTSKIKSNIQNMANFLNIQKLVSGVTGGGSLEQLRTMQAEFKKSMNVNNEMFRQIQGNLIQQSSASYDALGLTFKDASNYMSNISSYSVKSYNQAVAIYKQVAVGTKYLGLTSQNISDLVKTQNAIADRDYMDKQMALLAALGTNNAVAENYSDLTTFISQNATSLQARYGANASGMMNSAVITKTVADSLLGNESSLVSNLMAELMGASDFSQLSQSTQNLIAWSGQTSKVWSQMRSGNVDFSSIIPTILSSVGNLNQGQRTSLENFGLKDWITVGGSYSRNSEEFLNLMKKQYEALQGIDLTTEEGRELAKKNLKKQNDTRTWYEKFGDKILSIFNVQNQDWSQLLGISQALSTAVTGTMLVLDARENLYLAGILRNTAASAGVKGVEATGTIKGTSFLSTKGGKVMSGIGGALMIANDAIGGYDQGGGGWQSVVQSARNAFTGNTNRDNDLGTNVVGIGSNMLKGAMIGGAFGHPVAGAVIGGVVGLISSFLPAIKKNTDATKDNTKAIETQDSIYTNSAMALYYDRYGAGGEKGLGFGDGDARSGSYSFPWHVSRGFGMDWKYVNGKKTNQRAMHYGIDMTSKSGTPIGAAMSGKVIATGRNDSGAGIYTRILGDDGLVYKYFHQLKTPPVNVGDYVNVGDTVGYMGSTGNSSGTHLHFQVERNGTPIDPVPYITGGLFSASGKTWTAPTSEDSVPIVATENDKIYYLAKDAILGKGDGGTQLGVGGDYAKSNDIDRLIEVITNMKNEQEEQRSFMQALAGKNTFVFGK